MDLAWDWGTAYDLFMSLEVLHEPAKFGLRGAWAAVADKKVDMRDDRRTPGVNIAW